jgi:hypothetical protein
MILVALFSSLFIIWDVEYWLPTPPSFRNYNVSLMDNFIFGAIKVLPLIILTEQD